MNRLVIGMACGVLMVVMVGCRQATEEGPAGVESARPRQQGAEGAQAGWQLVAESELSTRQAAQRDRALSARDAMFTSLKTRLTEVVGSAGPAAAIDVCSKEAPQIAERVAREHRLEIGRTSFRLRNPDNEPPEWARPLVERRVEQPRFLTSDGTLAVLLPIRMQDQCLLCHGAEQAIPEPVKTALNDVYPEDRATGFADGDLRGWFWIEVPPEGEG